MVSIIVLGGGTAGLTAAIYARRAGYDCLVLEGPAPGGRILTTLDIENYPGMPGVSGFDLIQALRSQALTLGAQILGEAAKTVSLGGEVKRIVTDAAVYEARAVVIATGERGRLLGVPGELELAGRGVSYCATCDGAFFRAKSVAVVGGGNTALEDALYLARICAQVHIIHRRDEFRAAGATVAKAREMPNIFWHLRRTVDRIDGERAVRSVALAATDGGAGETLEVSGVFVAVGSVPQTALFAGQLALEADGHIAAGEDCVTCQPGVFAAGDVRAKSLRQLVTAASDGAVAATQAAHYLAFSPHPPRA